MRDWWRGTEILSVSTLFMRIRAAGETPLWIPSFSGYPYGLIVVLSPPCWAIPILPQDHVCVFQGFYPSVAQRERWGDQWAGIAQTWQEVLEATKGWRDHGGGEFSSLLGISGHDAES